MTFEAFFNSMIQALRPCVVADNQGCLAPSREQRIYEKSFEDRMPNWWSPLVFDTKKIAAKYVAPAYSDTNDVHIEFISWR
jgi:hypothetical protein